MSPLARAIQQGFLQEIVKIADSFSGGVEPVAARVPTDTAPAPTPTPTARAPRRPAYTPLASERAEHLTDIGGLGMMAGASADELMQAVTGESKSK